MRHSRSADYVILDGRWLIVEILEREGRSVTANLYRNPKEFIEDQATERRVGLRLTCPRPYHRGCSTYGRQGSSAGAA